MIEKLHTSLISNAHHTAFFINEQAYTYRDLNSIVASIQHTVFPQLVKPNRIGIIANDDIQTYSAILACLLSGITYVPIEPGHPITRNRSIIEQSGLKNIFCSSTDLLTIDFLNEFQSFLVSGHAVDNIERDHFVVPVHEDSIAYILFTSGTTGFPKGVPITRKNLEFFLESTFEKDTCIGNTDKFLQLFDLTFDLSVYSYLLPLIAGACVFTIPKNKVKYSYAINLLETYKITHALSVPSFINFLRPYFKEIRLPSVKKWMFCGEALQCELLIEWQKCIPNAGVFNVYGPTEATIFCTEYFCSTVDPIREYNGIVSIGKPFNSTEFLVIDENALSVQTGNIGELCISGSQVTKGYIGLNERNRNAFLTVESLNSSRTYYRAGDLAFQDNEGYYFFVGRSDSQVKIQGYRVELGEIENHVLAMPGIDEAIVIQKINKQGIPGLYLFITPEINEDKAVMGFLKERIPEYMLPKQINSMNAFPLNVNGKIDRNALKEMIS